MGVASRRKSNYSTFFNHKPYNKTQFTFNMMVKAETVCLVVLMSITLSSCLPLDLGFGGVFKNPEADAYWERRFGRGFFTNLASIQKNINSQAKLIRLNWALSLLSLILLI